MSGTYLCVECGSIHGACGHTAPLPPISWTTCEQRAEWITPADIGMQSSVSAEDFKAELDRLGIRSRSDLR